MIDSKKEQEREELHRAIWAIADELRGAVDGWDFKKYVLGTMFYRYISENLTSYINMGEADAGNPDFDFAKMSDADAEEAREGLVEEIQNGCRRSCNRNRIVTASDRNPLPRVSDRQKQLPYGEQKDRRAKPTVKPTASRRHH